MYYKQMKVLVNMIFFRTHMKVPFGYKKEQTKYEYVFLYSEGEVSIKMASNAIIR